MLATICMAFGLLLALSFPVVIAIALLPLAGTLIGYILAPVPILLGLLFQGVFNLLKLAFYGLVLLILWPFKSWFEQRPPDRFPLQKRPSAIPPPHGGKAP